MMINETKSLRNELLQIISDYKKGIIKKEYKRRQVIILNELFDNSKIFMKKGELEESLIILNNLIELIRIIGDKNWMRRILTLQAKILGMKGEYVKALSLCYDALEISKVIGNMLGKIIILNHIGGIKRSLGEVKESLKAHEEALVISEKLNDKRQIADTLNHIGNLKRITGNYDESLKFYEKSLSIFKKINHKEGECLTLLNIGLIYLNFDEISNSNESFEEAYNIMKELDSTLEFKGVYYNRLGNVFLDMGEYQKSFDNLQKSLEIANELNDVNSIILSYSNISQIYKKWGDYTKSLEVLEKALLKALKIGNKHSIGLLYNQFGQVYEEMKEHNKAFNYYMKSLEIKKEVMDIKGQAIAFNNIGSIKKKMGDDSNSLEFFKKALLLNKQIKHRDGEAICLSNMGEIYLKKQQTNKAIQYLKESLKILESVGNKAVKAIVLKNLAYVYATTNEFSLAYKLIKKSLLILEDLIGVTKLQINRMQYRGINVNNYHLAIHILLNLYKVNNNRNHLYEALKILELSKSREVIDKEKAIARSNAIDNHEINILLRKKDKCLEVIEQLKYQIRILNLKHSDQSDNIESIKSKLTKLSEDIEAKKKELLEINVDLQKKHSYLGIARNIDQFKPICNKTKILLKNAKTIIWEFFYDEELLSDYFGIFCWDMNEINFFSSNKINIKNGLDSIARFNKEIKQRNYINANSILEELSRKLGEWLPEKIWQTLNDRENLIIIPHGKLHSFPWLITSNNSGTQTQANYLGLQIPTSRNYSLSLLKLEEKKNKKCKALLISNQNINSNSSLQGAIKEIELIQSTLTKVKAIEILILSNKKATKENFLKMMKEKLSLIHFAGHAEYDLENPWLSNIKLYHPWGYYPYTIQDFLINKFNSNPLVILSACESGKGTIRKGDEPLSLVIGLFIAGASSVVSTNWLLDDSLAPNFIATLYEELIKGSCISKALFITRKKLVSLFEMNIIDWAVFDIYGSPFKKILS